MDDNPKYTVARTGDEVELIIHARASVRPSPHLTTNVADRAANLIPGEALALGLELQKAAVELLIAAAKDHSGAKSLAEEDAHSLERAA